MMAAVRISILVPPADADNRSILCQDDASAWTIDELYPISDIEIHVPSLCLYHTTSIERLHESLRVRVVFEHARCLTK